MVGRAARPVSGLARTAIVVLIVVSCGRSAEPASGDGSATVVEAVDGDTLVVEIGGQEEEVRLLGIDTPETKHPSRPVECFGAEASTRTGELLPVGASILLVRDAEARDQYGRLLAYVYRSDDELFVNLSLAEEGFADVLTYQPNVAHAPELELAVGRARAEGRGLWGACGGADVPAGAVASGP